MTGDAGGGAAGPRQRSIGFWECWALTVGTMIGSGIFMLPAVLAPYGLVSFGGWLLTAGGSITIALSIGRLARHSTRSGGPYVYALDTFGSLTGFFVGWTYWVGGLLANPAVAISFVGYLGALVPGLQGQPAWQAACAQALIWTMTLISIRGVKEAGFVQLVLTLLKLAPLGLIIGAAFFAGKTPNLPQFNPTGGSPLAVLSATALLTMWAFLGIEGGCFPAASVRDPTKTIPRAVVIGALTVAGVYIASTAAVMLLVPADVLKTSTSPCADAARALGSWGPTVIAIGAMIATVGALNGNIFVTGLTSMAVALDGLAPKSLAKLNKGDAPWVSLILQGVLSSILLMANYSRGLVDAFTFLIQMGTIATLIPYLIIGLAELKRSLKSAVGWALVGLIAAIYSAFAIFGSGEEPLKWGLVMTAAGLPVYLLMRRANPAPAAALAQTKAGG